MSGISLVDWHGDRSPVLAIHGITANVRAFDGLARALAPMHPMLAMDLGGRGESDTPPDGYDVEPHVSDAVAVLDAGGVGTVPRSVGIARCEYSSGRRLTSTGS